MNLVGVALLLFTFVAPAPATTDWPSVAKTARESIVSVESKGGSCTGFVVNANVKGDLDYIQTAAHCAGDEMFADSAVARVVWKDVRYDLMILEVADTGRPALHLAKKNPVIGDEIASWGYGMALARPMFRTAHVSDDETQIPGVEGGPFIMIDAGYVPGQSGGPCINAQGEVVSIVQEANGLLGIGVGAERMRSKAGRYYDKDKP